METQMICCQWTRSSVLLMVFSVVGSMVGCAHQPTYKPEVGAIGTKFSHGGVVYSVPPDNPVLKMKLVSAGITSDNQLSIRIYFVRKGPPQGEYLLPSELSIILPDTDVEIHPAKIHASGKGRPMIRLAELPRQAIELLFPVPPGGHNYPSLRFLWKIHYFQAGDEKVIAQSEKFDLKDHHLKNGVGAEMSDTDYPFDEYTSFPADSDWIPAGWLWW
jgi:hypothetical protein